jgi:3-hydroxybutyryl-CoA dehydrogenase
VMKLVEIIKGLETSQDTMNATLQLAKVLQKTTTISRDLPGFIANRCLMPFINEAIFALSEVKFLSYYFIMSFLSGNWH